jgi:hypothetical protein
MLNLMKTAYLWPPHLSGPLPMHPEWWHQHPHGTPTEVRSPFNTWPGSILNLIISPAEERVGERVSGRVGVHPATKQSNNKKPTFLAPPHHCSTTMISIRACSTKTVFWSTVHALYLLGNEMAWKGLVDVTKKSQKPQHNNLPCFAPLLHSNPISCTAFLLQKVRGIREWQLGQGTNWIAYQKAVTIGGHVAMSSDFVLGPTGASEEQAQGSKSLKAHSVQISKDHSWNPYQQCTQRTGLPSSKVWW